MSDFKFRLIRSFGTLKPEVYEMVWHFDQVQWWSYYTHAGVNYGGEFGLRLFNKNSQELLKSIQALEEGWLNEANRKHWGEQNSRYPLAIINKLSSFDFDCEIRCPDNLRFHKINNHLVISKFILLQTAHFLPYVPETHKCRRLHGHNFGLWISIDVSNFDSETSELIDYVNTCCFRIKSKLDHCILNDIEGLSNPTSENIALWIHEKLTAMSLKVFNILCIETQASAACYHGNDNWTCWKSFDFESVWRPSSDSISGHSFKLTAGVTGGLVKPYDWVLDFSEIKEQIKPLIDEVDHQDLSCILEGRGNSPEGLLEWFSQKSVTQNKYDFCLQYLSTRGAYRIDSIKQLCGAIPYLDWRG